MSGCWNRWVVVSLKGQINVGFIVSLVIFLSLTYYVVVVLTNITLPHFTQLTQKEQESEAYMISELLISQPGKWQAGQDSGSDWESYPENTTRLGLVDGYHVLEMDKIAGLKALSREEIGGLLGERMYRICVGYGENDCDLLEVNS